LQGLLGPRGKRLLSSGYKVLGIPSNLWPLPAGALPT